MHAMDVPMSRPAARHRKLPSMNEAQLYAVSEMFKALSDPTRLRLLTALSQGEACVHELCDHLDMSQPAVSHQLRLLRVQRLVAARRAGREIFYSLADEHVLDLVRAASTHADEAR